MSELRERLLDDSNLPPVPPDAPEGIQTLGSRQAGLVALLPGHLLRYRTLYNRFHCDGPGPELSAQALELANDFGLLLQEIRRHDTLVLALRHAAAPPSPVTAIPFSVLDRFYGSLLLLTGPENDSQRVFIVDPDFYEKQFFEPGLVYDWMAFNGYEEAGH